MWLQLPKNENLGKLGLNWKKQLKPNAVPAIFPRTTATFSKSRHSCAFEKRERARVTKTLQFDGSIMLFLKVLTEIDTMHASKEINEDEGGELEERYIGEYEDIERFNIVSIASLLLLFIISNGSFVISNGSCLYQEYIRGESV